MTITDDERAAVPDWLDLDKVVPKRVRDELEAVAEEMAMLKPQVTALAQRAFAAEQECEAFIGKVTAEVDEARMFPRSSTVCGATCTD